METQPFMADPYGGVGLVTSSCTGLHESNFESYFECWVFFSEDKKCPRPTRALLRKAKTGSK
jgi:hypothetical protein